MSDLIPQDAVKAIQAGVAVEKIEVNGQTYTTREVYLPPKDPMPSTLSLHTLAGIVDFVGKFDKSKIAYIHVKDAANVYIMGELEGTHRARPYYLQAQPFNGGKFPFGQYQEQEDFIISTQACFVPSDQRASLLAFVGNLRDEAVDNRADDGVTQTVTVRRGISMVTPEKVPNPVTLAPYRTFPEIAQPSSPFILRVRKGCEVALYQTADFEWELKAIQAISDYLKAKIKDVAVIA